jgi:membrane-associated phospholipid phosphatase
MSHIAKIISFIFHPLLLPTYWTILMAKVLPRGLEPFNEEQYFHLVGLIFIMTFFLPIVFFGLLKAIGLIPAMDMHDRKDRIKPFAFVTLWYVVVALQLVLRDQITLDDNFMKFMIIIDVLIFVGTLFTFFFKISIHSIGMWGLVGMLLGLSFFQEDNVLLVPLVITLALSGIVMSSRLQLNAHTPTEVAAGSVVGLVVSVAGVLLLF